MLPQSGGATPHYTPVQTAIVYLLVAVWSGCVGEPATRFWLASRRRPAVQRARLRALSAGYGGIVGLLLFALVASALAANPSSTGIGIVTQLLALTIVPLLYAGFAPPRWLRSRSVGSAARRRVSSEMARSCRGTLRSSRTSTRFPRTSASVYGERPPRP